MGNVLHFEKQTINHDNFCYCQLYIATDTIDTVAIHCNLSGLSDHGLDWLHPGLLRRVMLPLKLAILPPGLLQSGDVAMSGGLYIPDQNG